ncbi:hypothetical protein T12_12211 [Trichinella patagoniensis]|uniref:Uncharacterized protein n=1 Tax=Trichinella patagoniensis TaxID=990121 RepID=A0A0V0Z519_9BILA|nr:hypothetical protein T12_12211 [Trichinella patagoniensis]
METGGCLSNTSDAEGEDKELATPSAARLLLHSYVQRNVNVQDNTMQNLERVWFDYCSIHVSTVVSHVSQQFRFTHRHTMGCVSAVELFL